ncbi:hypothetical protein [Agromyces mariniharenae]|uniref:Uncharacterized protein n=1 Tax=Agromyces mariniharenae TaxID=2604423 RepID=A0A5S4V7B0_9MICO|nr:hypothetical protein [Agromyces mariniharenae]TYL53753.1 hypothetical protein FYC51_08925 [Agromyces mariniharenae]
MRKAWLVSLGVAVAVGAAAFVGAAAATTGAPVFYDARHPAPAPTDAGGYDVSAGADPGSTTDGAVDEADAGGAPVASNGPTPPDRASGATPATPTPTPAPAPTPTPGADDPDRAHGVPDVTVPPTLAERESWLAFQQVLRDCMADAGHEYLYWEWWNPGPDTSNRFPAMPPDLSRGEVGRWQAALEWCSDQAGSMRSGVEPPPADGIGIETED